MVMESMSEITPIMVDKNQPNFVQPPYIRDIVRRAMNYLQVGFPIHFCGHSGTGKTTLAMYVAAQIGRPVILIHGDEELSTSELVGGQYGFRRKKVVDNFIQSVLKSEEDLRSSWIDNRLTVACKYGFTLIYDEFTRSRPEANNILLPILEEKILDLPAARGEESYLRVHPDFSAIFTSNPEEYAGVYRSQDALRDRMITIKLTHYDRETEISITQAKSGIPRSEDAEKVVDIVRGFREVMGNGFKPTIRACIMIAKVLKLNGSNAPHSDRHFVQSCMDILLPESNGLDSCDLDEKKMERTVTMLIQKYYEPKSGRQKGEGGKRKKLR